MTGPADNTKYNFDHAQALGETLASARALLPLVRAVTPVHSVVDVGCGFGMWLAVWESLGVKQYLGVDGDWIDRKQLMIRHDRFIATDLSGDILLNRRFDLAMSLEVAEHLAPERADGFVAALTRLAPVVLFSAAVPGQGGTGHINEQWPEYWISRFESQGYVPIDCLRHQIWNDPGVCWWYAQNTFLFVEWTLANQPQWQALQRANAARPVSVVHPRLFELRVPRR